MNDISEKKNIFVVGWDDFNIKKLKRVPRAKNYEFYSALDYEELRGEDDIDPLELIKKACEKIDASGVTPDAILTYWDFPATLITPILSQRYGLRAASLKSVVKCEHKFWSRMEQRKVVIDNIPSFQAFDPFAEDPYRSIGLLPPYWIKPIKSFRSFLAFRINDEWDFKNALEETRNHIESISKPFHRLISKYRMPEMISQMQESCIAESLLSGSQCTLEGYVYEGEVIGYGVIDSLRENDRSSFSRYQYPSSLPLDVQYRMMDIARRVIQQIDMDDACFNMEFFYNQTDDKVWLLEINPRLSQSHSDLFEKVHGTSHHQIMMDIALGKRPSPMERKGQFPLASKFFHRHYEAGVVKKVPSESEIKELEEKISGLTVELKVSEGTDLKSLAHQDSYSFELAEIYLGGQNELDLLEKYNQCIEGLKFEFDHFENGHT